MHYILVGSHVSAQGHDGRYEVLEINEGTARLRLLGNDKQTSGPVEPNSRLERIPVSTLSLLYPLQPLCDRHQRPMMPTTIPTTLAPLTLVVLQGQTPTADTPRSYRCTTANCTRVYDMEEGYFDFIDGQPQMKKSGKISCYICEMAMYLAHACGRSPDRLGEWHCPQCGTNITLKD
jgi:hypothetical protein